MYLQKALAEIAKAFICGNPVFYFAISLYIIVEKQLAPLSLFTTRFLSFCKGFVIAKAMLF